MIIFVLLGSVSLVAAVLALIIDIAQGLEAGQLVLTPLGKTWFELDRSSLNFSQAIIQRYTLPEIWDPGIVTLLQWPTVFVAAGLGVILLLIAGAMRTRKRH